MPPETQAAETKDNRITVTVDGVEHRIEPERGKTILGLCEDLGIEIPTFCYHPGLTIPANCRMCLVEVEKAPKLLPACHTELRDGLVVRTNNDRVKRSQEAVLEFLLVNHPVDCPICDQAGECPLQDQYFKYDAQPSRVTDPVQKVKKRKAVQLGPRVTLDQERCVLCSRCVRFMDEVAREPQLGIFWRNDHAYVETFPEAELSSNYSLNTVQICPVGALTSSDFRFQKRVWNLESSRGICDGCDRGCNTWVDQDDRKVYRFRARENASVNRWWMCDHGRLSYGYLNEDRLTSPRAGRGDVPRLGVSLEIAGEVAAKLGPIVGNPEGFGLLVSARASTEDALLAAWFAKEVMELDHLYLGGRQAEQADAILLRSDRNPNRLGVRLAAQAFGLEVRPFETLMEAVIDGRVKMLHAVGLDVPIDESMAAATLESLEYFSASASNLTRLARCCDVVLPAATPAECDGTYVNFMGRAQRFSQAFEPRGEAAPHWQWLMEIAAGLGEELDYHDADEVWAALAGRSPVLGALEWQDIGEHGAELEGQGAPEKQTGGLGLKDEKGVSRWPR